jgi:hypothetical protein
MSTKGTHRVKFGTIYVDGKPLETGDLISPTAAQLAAFGDKLEPLAAKADDGKPADAKTKETK